MDRLHFSSSNFPIGFNNSSKRLREEETYNSKPPLGPPQAKKCHVAPPPPLSDPSPRLSDVSNGMVTTPRSGKATPRGMAELWPKIELDGCDFFDVFFKSHLDTWQSISKPFVLEGYKPSDEILDDDVERIWGPILRQPLVPLISRSKRRVRV